MPKKNQHDIGTTEESDKGRKKKKYISPKLTHYGDVRDVTLSGSLVAGESGGAGNRKNLG
jgi:hypothetical protein